MCDCLTKVVEAHSGGSAEVVQLKSLLCDKKQQHYSIGTRIVEVLQPVRAVQQKLESTQLLLSQYHDLVSVKLHEILSNIETNVETNNKGLMLMAVLLKDVVVTVKVTCYTLCDQLLNRCRDTVNKASLAQ